MTHLSRVVWSEGMHLAQHHFQVQSKYFESSIHFALSHLFFAPYGLVGYQLDAEALRNGTVSLIHARGIMPDGLAFHIPESDPTPDPLDIGNLFSPVQDSHLVLLTIPAYQRHGPNYAAQNAGDGRDVRYLTQTALVFDETTGRDEKPVSVGRKNFRLSLDQGVGDGVVSLPLARVRRDGAGRFIYDPDYVPPCLQIGASEHVMDLLRRLVEMLDAKSDATSRGRGRQVGPKSSGEYAGHEVASFWLLHAIHSSLAPLRHHLLVKRSRPEQLYLELARLAGALCTFALDSHPRSLPLYDHENLGDCFNALDQHIRTHLEIVMPTRYVSIPLRRETGYFHRGVVTDSRCFGRSRWIFGIRSSAGDAEVIARVPQLVKICSWKYLPELVRRALPGLALEHLPVPPPAISPHADSHYFSVSKSGPCWNTLPQMPEVGIYVPDAAFPNAELELVVMLE